MSTIAIGNFDGLHLGHQFLLMKMKAIAELENRKPIAYTFVPNTHEKKRLTSDIQKVKFIKNLGVKSIVLQDFSKEFAALNSDEFINLVLLKQLGATHIIVGSNFKFGANGFGNAGTLANKKKIKTTIVEPIFAGSSICSSSAVRCAVEFGNLNLVKQLLGRPYSLSGNVIEGRKRGRLLGYPTANLKIEQEVIPPLGVYAIHDNCMRFGIANIGRRPTFEINNDICIEIYFLNFNTNLYKSRIEIFLDLFVRKEMTFASADKLKIQILNDIKTVEKFYSKTNQPSLL